MKQRSSVLSEIVWLAYFLGLFVIAMYALVGALVPHHFNVMVAIVLAGMFSALGMIATRAWWTHRRRE